MNINTTEWSSGPRCGVNNCRSHLWRSERGQRICQNGHVRHGDIEMADDEEDFYGGGGRRMTQASQATVVDDSDTRRLYKGPEARKLLLMAIQVVLREQVHWLMKRQFVAPEIEPLVKALYAIYSEHAVLGADRGSTRDTDGHQLPRIRLSATVSICRLACLLMRLPIYSYDFVRWIKYDRFPYLMAHNIVPNEITSRMGQGLLLPLIPSDIVSTNHIHDESKKLIDLFYRTARIDFPPVSIHSLLYKIIRDLFLPPEIYPGVLQILTDRYRQNYGLFCIEGMKSIELRVFAAVFVCTKLFYGLDNTQRRPTNVDEPAANIVDWDLWAAMVRRTWIEEETFATTNPQSVVNWDRAKVGRFLKWLDTQYYPPDDEINYEMPESKVTTRNIFRQFPRKLENLDRELETVKYHSPDRVMWIPDKSEGVDLRERNHVDYMTRRLSYMRTQYVDRAEWEDEGFEQLPSGTETDNGQFVSKYQRVPEFYVHNTDIPGGEDAGFYPSMTILQEINDVVHTSTDAFNRLPQTRHKFESDSDEWVDESDIEIGDSNIDYVHDSESDEYSDEDQVNQLVEGDEQDEAYEFISKRSDKQTPPPFPVNSKIPGPRISTTSGLSKSNKSDSTAKQTSPDISSSIDNRTEAIQEADDISDTEPAVAASTYKTRRYRGLILKPGERYPFESNHQGTYLTRLLITTGARLCCETETEVALMVSSLEKFVITATDWPEVPYKNKRNRPGSQKKNKKRNFSKHIIY